MHHDFAWSLDLLQTIEGDIVQIASAVEIPLFVSHHLLEEIISSSFSLLLFDQQVVCGCNLVMFVVLYIRYSLIKVTIGCDARRHEAVLDLAKELLQNRHSILADNYTLHLA